MVIRPGAPQPNVRQDNPDIQAILGLTAIQLPPSSAMQLTTAQPTQIAPASRRTATAVHHDAASSRSERPVRISRHPEEQALFAYDRLASLTTSQAKPSIDVYV